MYQSISLDIDTGELTKVTYSFYFSDGALYLDTYHKWEKPTKRSGYKNKGFYNRLNQRDSTIKELEVPLTDEVKEMAKKELIERVSKVTIKTWSERGK